MTFSKATKSNSKLRLAITGIAGSGKTFGALLIAQGLGGNLAMIDTENGSGNVYADIFDYDICSLEPPYDPRRYIQCIHEAEQAGYNIIIIDSLSHAWDGEGGILDLHYNATKNIKNGYAAWRDITPIQNKLIQAILASSAHIIVTLRAKTEYVQEKNERGFTEIRKVGLAPVQRKDVDYEFGTVFEIGSDHVTTVSKDRTRLFGDKPFRISQAVGEALRNWLENENKKKEG